MNKVQSWRSWKLILFKHYILVYFYNVINIAILLTNLKMLKFKFKLSTLHKRYTDLLHIKMHVVDTILTGFLFVWRLIFKNIFLCKVFSDFNVIFKNCLTNLNNRYTFPQYYSKKRFSYFHLWIITKMLTLSLQKYGCF